MKNKFLFSLLLLVSLGSVFAATFPPTYDYRAGTYNLTLTNAPTYNETSRAYIFGPAGNQKATFAKTMNTTEFPLNTTPYTVLAYINPMGFTGVGEAETLAVFKGYNSTNGTGYAVNFALNSTGFFRTQFDHGGTLVTNSLLGGFSIQGWIPVAWVFNGTQCWSYTDNSTANSGNASCLGKAAVAGTPLVQTIPDGLCGKTTSGGYANGFCNASIKNVMIFNRTISAEEFTNYTENRSFSSAGILANFTFENTTAANVIVGATLVRVLPANSQGFHSALSPCANETWVDSTGSGTASTVANFTECQFLLNQTNVKKLRFESELWNICTYENSTTGTCIYNYTNTSNNNFKNFRSQISLVAYAAAVNDTVHIGISDMPPWLATNNSECNYGVGGANQTLCNAVSYSSTRGYGSVVGRYLIDLGCFSYGKVVCYVDGDNEPYLAAFYLPNATAVPQTGTCVVRSGRINDHYYNTFSNMTAYLTAAGANLSLISTGSPAFTTATISSCGEAAAVNYSSRFPYAGSNSPSRFNWHPYSSGSTMTLRTEYDIIEPLMALNGWTSHWGITESEWNNAAISNASDQSQKTAGLGYAFTYLLQNTTAQYNLWYKLASITTAGLETANYFGFRPTNIETPLLMRGSFIMSNITQTVQQGGSVYNCSTTDTDVSCAYIRRNSTYGILFLSNFQNNQLGIDNLSIQGVNITSVTKVTTNSTETVTSGVANPSYLAYYGVETYQITTGATNLSLTQQPSGYLVNITEPNSQNFNITITNPSNQTYNINWSMNGTQQTSCFNLTTCTFTGGYTTAGQYNITATVVGETNTATALWLLQINQTARNISAAYAPDSPTTVFVGTPRGFTFTLTNPDSVPYTATWRLNGTNQTACYNATSCSVTLNSSTSTTLNVTIVGNTNTLSNQWTLVVSSVSPSVASACANSSAGFVAGITFIAILIAVIFVGGILYLVKGVKDRSFSVNPIDWVQENVTAVMFVALLFGIGVVIITLLAGQC